MLKFNNTLEIVLFIIMVGLFIAPLQVNSNYSLIFENVIGKVLIAIIILSILNLFFVLRKDRFYVHKL